MLLDVGWSLRFINSEYETELQHTTATGEL